MGFFGDGFDFNAPGWTFSHTGVFAEFTPRDWSAQTVDVGHLVTNALYAPNVDGDCIPGSDDQSGVLVADSPEFTVPAGGGGLYFDHLIASEPLWDGGNVQISVNGGAWTSIVDANFTYNPYNAVMNTAGAGNTSPLAGQRGFTGTDGGSVSGSWGRSLLNLGALAAPGDKVRLRYRFGQGIPGQLPDLFGILFRPGRMRRIDAIFPLALPQDRTILAKDDGLAAGCADVETDERHESAPWCVWRVACGVCETG